VEVGSKGKEYVEEERERGYSKVLVQRREGGSEVGCVWDEELRG
jgi:hypothetical protein